MTIPWTATVWDPDTGNHSIRSLYGLHPGDSSFEDSISGGSRITLNRGIDAIVRYILLLLRHEGLGAFKHLHLEDNPENNLKTCLLYT